MVKSPKNSSLSKANSSGWSVSDSRELYGIKNWSGGYFNVNSSGNVEMSPSIDSTQKIDLKELVNELKERGLKTPLLLRFSDLVNSRIEKINQVFLNSIEKFNYQGKYRGVYPIKVNHQRHLLDELTKFGKKSNLGLEAGSKPELLLAMALLKDSDAYLICNGFKDQEFIENALLSQKLNLNTLIVVDRFAEIDLILKAAKKLKIKPRIGFRLKLDSKGCGKWVESSGLNSKFGLSSIEILRGVEVLIKNKMLDSLELIHFHVGSQITSIRSIKDSLVEATRIFVELTKLGAKIKVVDVGGGLGVDYDGSQSNCENSINYTLQEYANEIVSQIGYICDEFKIPHPNIVTEAGRALVSYHSVLIFDIVGTPNPVNKISKGARNNKHESVQDMIQLVEKLTTKNLNESIHDAIQLRDETLNLFKLGYLGLAEKAYSEEVFREFCRVAFEVAKKLKRKPKDLRLLKKYIRQNFYCNFSIFQSAPDCWAVDQLFPIMPIMRLNEKPTEKGILLDLTCDSDGKITKFIDNNNVKNSLEMHTLKPDESYFVGMFLIGAYQETLGDFHNLFGDTDAVHVKCRGKSYSVEHVVEGDTVEEVLNYVEYDRGYLVGELRKSIENALENKTLTLKESRDFIKRFEQGLNGYTYLENDIE